ncbi:MAG: hypothetical protein AAB460_00730 [Patescibacteria group bacterium]
MTTRIRKYRWFVGTSHPEANRHIGNELAAQGLVVQSEMRETLCADSIRRDLWEIASYKLVVAFQRGPLGRTMEVFRAEGGGRPAAWPPVARTIGGSVRANLPPVHRGTSHLPPPRPRG